MCRSVIRSEMVQPALLRHSNDLFTCSSYILQLFPTSFTYHRVKEPNYTPSVMHSMLTTYMGAETNLNYCTVQDNISKKLNQGVAEILCTVTRRITAGISRKPQRLLVHHLQQCSLLLCRDLFSANYMCSLMVSVHSKFLQVLQ